MVELLKLLCQFTWDMSEYLTNLTKIKLRVTNIKTISNHKQAKQHFQESSNFFYDHFPFPFFPVGTEFVEVENRGLGVCIWVSSCTLHGMMCLLYTAVWWLQIGPCSLHTAALRRQGQKRCSTLLSRHNFNCSSLQT